MKPHDAVAFRPVDVDANGVAPRQRVPSGHRVADLETIGASIEHAIPADNPDVGCLPAREREEDRAVDGHDVAINASDPRLARGEIRVVPEELACRCQRLRPTRRRA